MQRLFLTKRGTQVSSKSNKHEAVPHFTAPLSELENVIREVLESGGEFSLVTAGTSMLPLLRNRKDTVVLAKHEGRLCKYDIPLYKRDSGQFTLHRVLKVKNDEYYICGDNQLVIEKGITDKHVIAVVKRIVRNGKTIDLQNSFAYKIYVFFWCRCFFVRYTALKFRALGSRIKKFFINSNKK